MTPESLRWTLNAWGRFVRQHRSQYLGYPRINIIHRMIKEGPGASQATGEPEFEIADDILSTDKAVAVIPGDYRDAVYLIYVYRLSVRRAAEVTEISKSSFYRTLGEAEQRIAGFIDADNYFAESACI